MQELGKVIEAQGSRATVQIQRSSACKSCEHSCGFAGEISEIDQIEVDVANPVGAQPGDTVALEMGAKQIFLASISIYLIPPIFLILGYFVFSFLGNAYLGWEGELFGILGASLSFLTSIMVLRLIDNKAGSSREFDPEITAVVNPEDDEECL
ncbi:SoxR reducing system RseC family protein [Halarsenatibacter silvermanii]|uniref:Positive regulator of sigma(E), RseC/MucC n=1 Tax=Halarsenatibacter silvermanii TaxID=321763 RepID=A0A1G9SR13_9FIRM|nr:SoxR reducing system RseC family protein [Halarsenatibacter silvermanii]SDM37305.1 positive regulator of sigma(E), RseC/MucC [Halarsenatibacter silvermanii]